jgi:hypothetical protein
VAGTLLFLKLGHSLQQAYGQYRPSSCRTLVNTGPGSGLSILGVNWTLASLGIITVGLRMWLRRKIGYTLDDWFMVTAAAMMIVYEALLTESVIWGLGRKYESITLAEYMNLQYWQLLAQFFLNPQSVLSR